MEKREGIFFWMLMSVQINSFSNLGYEDSQKEGGGGHTQDWVHNWNAE